MNRVICDALASVPAKRQLFLRLEELRSQPSLAAQLFAFLGAPYRDEYFAAFARPHNVNRPVDRLLWPEQAAQFARIAQPMMKRLGYAESPEYAVNY